MSKTKETQLIEEKLDNWKPSKLANFKPSYMRTQVGIHECTVTHGDTKSGIVDYVWIADGFANEKSTYKCTLLSNIKYVSPQFKCNRYPEEEIKILKCFTKLGVDESVCNNCVMKCRTVERNIAHYVICFEIKVTVNDFYSSHGHNFVGDLNYYILLNTVYDKVIQDIPEDIGVIVASINKNDEVTFRIKRDSKLTEISEEDRNWFLQTALSRERKKYKDLEQLHKNTCSDYEYNARNMASKLYSYILDLNELPSCFSQSKFSNKCICSKTECKDCNYSYSKYNRMINELLKEFGFNN